MAVANTAELRKLLLDEIAKVQTGQGDPKNAQAISSLAGKVLQSAKLDLEVFKYHKKAGMILDDKDQVLQLVKK